MMNGHSSRRKWKTILDLSLVFVILALIGAGAFVVWVDYKAGVGKSDSEKAMNSIIKAVARENERYVIDYEIERGQVPRIAISRSAWDVLASYSSELPMATVAITTTSNQMDLVSSEIQIIGVSSAIHCEADNGQVVTPRYFYVYTCRVTDSLP